MKKNYAYVMQDDLYDCGIASLCTIFLYFGYKINKEKLKDLISKQGTTALELINASKNLGIQAKGVKCNLSALKKENFPCIAHIIKDKNCFHYIVIFKRSKKQIIIFDPAEGILKLDINEFNNISTEVFIIFDKKEIIKYKDKRFKKFLIKIIKENKQIILKTIILSIFFISLSLIFNYYLKTIINNLNNSVATLITIAILFLIISIIKNLFGYLRGILIINLNKIIDQTINNKIIKHIIFLPYKYYINKTTGGLISIINDIENFKNIITKIFILCTIDLLLIISIIIFISFYNVLYFIFFLTLLLTTILIAFSYKEKFNEIYLKTKNKRIKYTSSLVEALNAYDSIKGLNLEEKIIQKNQNNYKELIKSEFAYNKKYNIFNIINDFFIEISYIFIIFISCILAINNIINTLDIILFSSIFYLFSNLLSSIGENISLYKSYQTSVNRVLDLLEEKTEYLNRNQFQIINKIEIKNLSFSYRKENILENINITINAKDKIFITGSSGIGKSTLIKLLLKYYVPKKGNILIDNINIDSLNLKTIRQNITYVSQNEMLFNDTIYNNLSIIKNDQKEIEKAINCTLINEMFEKRKISENFILEENAANISGGEKEKIIIARGLLCNSAVLIFDESFNEIDIDTERKILKNIINNYPDKIIILISHRNNNKDLFNKKYNFINKSLIKEEVND